MDVRWQGSTMPVMDWGTVMFCCRCCVVVVVVVCGAAAHSKFKKLAGWLTDRLDFGIEYFGQSQDTRGQNEV